MDITKKVMREVEVIDTDKIKVGDKLKLTYIGKDKKGQSFFSWDCPSHHIDLP